MTDNIHFAIRKYGIEKKNEIIWNYFGAIIIFLGLFLVGYCCGSRWIIRFAMILTFFLILGLLFISVVLMILLVSQSTLSLLLSLTSTIRWDTLTSAWPPHRTLSMLWVSKTLNTLWTPSSTTPPAQAKTLSITN
jgi:hypothetical protein